MLEARHLVKRFFGTAVVSDVSFEVRAGEVVGYLGPNGSGKSTTAKMLTGLLEASAGAVLFDGQDIALDQVAFRRRLGYVPEEPNLYTFNRRSSISNSSDGSASCRLRFSREKSARSSSCLACRLRRTRTSDRTPRA